MTEGRKGTPNYWFKHQKVRRSQQTDLSRDNGSGLCLGVNSFGEVTLDEGSKGENPTLFITVVKVQEFDLTNFILKWRYRVENEVLSGVQVN